MSKIVGWDESAKSRATCRGTSTAPGCGAIVEYNQNDIREYRGTDYSGGSDGQDWIDCPNCRKRIILKSW